MIDTLGQVSRTAAFAKMDAEGVTPEQAAELTGLKLSTCRSYFAIVRRNNPYRHRRPSPRGRKAYWIDIDVIEALQPHADARRLPMSEFIRELLATIADEQLVAAVLDDGATE